MSKKKPSFKTDTIFHVYNQEDAKENIFRKDENYHFFLERYAHYVYPVAQAFAFCLMPNHFHFAIKIRSKKELISYFGSTDRSRL